MADWKPLVLTVGLLVLVSEGATDQLHALETQEHLEMVSAMSNIGEALRCFGDVQNHNHDAINSLREFLVTSQKAHDNALNDFKDSMKDSLRLVGENCGCTKSLENITGVVETLTGENEDLKRDLTAQGEKVETLTQENADLKTQLAAKDEKVQSLTRDIENVKREYEVKEKKIKAGYEYFPGFGFYKYFSQAQTWADAVRLCSYDGAHLGIINSEEEARIYISIIANHPKIEGAYNGNYFYVGISEINNTREFVTLDGTPLSQSGYSTWDSGEPNSREENCGSINHDAKLNDIPCHMKFAYICESKYP